MSHGGLTLKIDKTELPGLIVLFVGVTLLAFTFFSAYGFLSGSLSILASSDLTELFGRAMAPLIEAVIRILYLGVMGWIGSILTIRAVQLLKREKETGTATSQPQVKSEAKQPTFSSAPAKTEPKPEAKEAKKAEKAENAEKNPVPEQTAQTEKEAKTKQDSGQTVEPIA